MVEVDPGVEEAVGRGNGLDSGRLADAEWTGKEYAVVTAAGDAVAGGGRRRLAVGFRIRAKTEIDAGHEDVAGRIVRQQRRKRRIRRIAEVQPEDGEDGDMAGVRAILIGDEGVERPGIARQDVGNHQR